MVLRASGSLMLLEFLESGFGFTDANRELMSLPVLIDYAPRDYENRGLVGYGCRDRINFEDVVCVMSPE